MERTVKIYVLKSPITNEIKYVGRSVNPESRYRVHLYLAKKNKMKNKKDAWICSLLNKNKKPLMEIIDEVNISEAVEKERFWIGKLKETCDLKNCRDYIENNYLFSEESRKKMSEAAKGNRNRRGQKLSEETKNKISQSKKGFKQTKKQILKVSKPILQCDKNGNIIKEWQSSSEAARMLNLNQGLISAVVNNCKYRKTHGGFTWKIKN